MTKSKVAILLCDYSPSIAPTFGNFAEQSAALLQRSGLSLAIEMFDAQTSQFPSKEQLNDIKAIWITGSASDSFENLPWILNLIQFIQDTRDTHPSVAFIGICFGHQIISRALGAKVGRNPQGWEFGSYEVQLSKDEEVREFFGGACAFKNMEVHQDIVFDQLPGFKNIGSTKTTNIQGWYKRGELLTFQGHPEFNEEVVDALLDTKKENLADEVYQHGKKSLKDGNDGLELGKLIVKFIGSS